MDGCSSHPVCCPEVKRCINLFSYWGSFPNTFYIPTLHSGAQKRYTYIRSPMNELALSVARKQPRFPAPFHPLVQASCSCRGKIFLLNGQTGMDLFDGARNGAADSPLRNTDRKSNTNESTVNFCMKKTSSGQQVKSSWKFAKRSGKFSYTQ